MRKRLHNFQILPNIAITKRKIGLNITFIIGIGVRFTEPSRGHQKRCDARIIGLPGEAEDTFVVRDRGVVMEIFTHHDEQ